MSQLTSEEREFIDSLMHDDKTLPLTAIIDRLSARCEELERENVTIQANLDANRRIFTKGGLPCCCRFDENDEPTIICGLHKEQQDNLSALLSAVTPLFDGVYWGEDKGVYPVDADVLRNLNSVVQKIKGEK